MSEQETHAALDGHHVEEIVSALESLEALEQIATPAPWKVDGALLYHGTSEVTASVPGTADRDFLVALRNHAPQLIRQCKNTAAIVADLDGVHEALGTDYSTSAAASVREWREDRRKAQGTYDELLQETVALREQVKDLKAVNQALAIKLHDERNRLP